ncbi:MAG: hypothetical protein L6R42_003055 [Xanthoria sp. 1 TBL-2021]|nr:MAG: hypothetical protein L6R42_003055 [Xanthoria sp. 1 TBL-2021]
MLFYPVLGQTVIIHLYAFSSALVQILPSSRSYGPDGPWQTVNVSLGNPPQFVQLLPGGIWASTILSDGVCKDNTEAQTCGSGGLYDPADSDTVDETTLRIKLPDPGSLDGGQSQANVSWRQIMETLQIPRPKYQPVVIRNFSIKLVDKVSMNLPDGSAGYPPQLGNLALGAPDLKHVFDGTPPVNASLIPAAIYQSGDISTNSFGLHIGSVAMGIPLSLWLGGYDSSRVLGSVSSQPYSGDQLLIDLLEVGIGVDDGDSPFPFAQKQGILRQGNASIGDSVQVSLDPLAPYLHLPQSTCAAIASYLPVSYQSKYKLYFWNTKDPRYEPLVRSPSFLSFTFRAPSLPQAELVIKVPFQLLNLTLQAPMIDTPTQYFPCRSPQAGGTHLSGYALGRAFLQAAFLAVNWDPNDGQWSLGQAPGPDTATAPQQEQFGNTFKSSTASWSDSWKGHWTPIKETVSTMNSTSPTGPNNAAAPKAGLSTGAKAGIGVGCAAAVALVAGIGLCSYRSHSGTRMASQISLQQAADAKRVEEEKLNRADIPSMVEAADPEPVEMSHREMFQELPATPPSPPPKTGPKPR